MTQSIRLSRGLDNIQKILEKNYTQLVFLISAAAVFGSLYFSEVERLAPCSLCWYQRIFIYPLLFLTTISLITNQRLQRKFIVCLTVPGMLIAIYHYGVQKFGIGKEFLNCTSGTPCDVIDVQYLGFITLPLLSFFAFLFINTIIFLSYKFNKKNVVL